jgi:hypothetical protein
MDFEMDVFELSFPSEQHPHFKDTTMQAAGEVRNTLCV